MNKKLYTHKIIKLRKTSVETELITPFTETPSGKEDKEKAHELFSIFTAEIIKKEVFFIR